MKNRQNNSSYALILIAVLSTFSACSRSPDQPREKVLSASAQVNGPDGKPTRLASLEPDKPVTLAVGEWMMIGTTKYTGLPPANGQPSEVRLEDGEIKTRNVKVEDQLSKAN